MVKDQDLFLKVVDGCFSPRRKIIKNSLATNFPQISTDQIKKILADLEIDSSKRGETLEVKEFVRLTNMIAIELSD